MIGAEVIELVQLHDRQDPGDDRAGAEPHGPYGDDALDGARSTPTDRRQLFEPAQNPVGL